MRHPRELGKADVEAYLSMLANERSVSPSTDRQAVSAILYLYKEVLGQELPWLGEIGRPPVRKRIAAGTTLSPLDRLGTIAPAVPHEP